MTTEQLSGRDVHVIGGPHCGQTVSVGVLYPAYYLWAERAHELPTHERYLLTKRGFGDFVYVHESLLAGRAAA